MNVTGRRIWILAWVVLSAACRPGAPGPSAPTERAEVTLASAASPSVRDTHEAFGRRFVVTAEGRGAAEAVQRMFAVGGNAVDAAVAASFAIAVERPQSTGIGGGGFMMIHRRKEAETWAVDFRERAPGKAFEKMYLDGKGDVIPGKSLEGGLSSGVPGMVAGVLAAHERFGALPRHVVMIPAIQLARDGFTIYPDLAEDIRENRDLLARDAGLAALYLDSSGRPRGAGEILKQPALAETLQTISREGTDGFYRGRVAKAMIEQSRKAGGLFTQEDFDSYRVAFRKPVRGTFKGYDVLSMPPPSSGGVHVVQILNVLEAFDLKGDGPFSPRSVHRTAAAMQEAFADRATHLGDSDFTDVPTDWLTSKEYAASLRSAIPNAKARPSSAVAAGSVPPKSPEHTTHFTIMDAAGDAVASTQTVNRPFGSGVLVAGTGILLNDEMDDFSVKPGVPNHFGAVGGEKNAVAPGKRPLSSMSPTIVLKDGRPVLALGSPSGTRIISCVLLTILNYLEYGASLYDSVAAVRYHHQWLPDEIRVDSPSFPPATEEALKAMGYSVRKQDIGCRVQAVAREGDLLHGVSDPRGEGSAVGEIAGP